MPRKTRPQNQASPTATQPVPQRPTTPTPAPDVHSRVVIENVQPQIEGGRYAIKRAAGDLVTVSANIFVDGHDALSALLRFRQANESDWTETTMERTVWGLDLWRASFRVLQMGYYYYTVEAWVDRFKSWRNDFQKKVAADQDVAVDILVGAELIDQAAERALGGDADKLRAWAKSLRSTSIDMPTRATRALDVTLAEIVFRYPDRRFARFSERELPVSVDPPKARFSSWYELFPRSCGSDPEPHGTFKDVEQRLPYIASMGFDVLYLPPIHPIGHTFRKGKNNTPVTQPGDVGSPWAIGSAEGGHKAIHSELGTLEDFRRLVARAREFGIDIALDIAFQCTPDHPYVKHHPEWFRWRPDGTIQYAENPPKKYQDIYPLEFENPDWRGLWEELKSVFEFWLEQGVWIFRVDNPHTKPFPFWEWVLAELKKEHPEALFLSEAFTRPFMLYRLAKIGFTHSYNYFPWRNTKWELTQYFTELVQTDVREFCRPHLWPNTPDILTEYLQYGGRPAFMTRLVLAATLGANYGIYGPAFELCENRALRPGSEEYLDSEKYQIRRWDLDRTDSLRDFIARVNRIRRENPALQNDWSLRFHPTDNDHLIAYTKHSEDGSNIILIVVNLDPHHRHMGWLDLRTEELGIKPSQTYQVHDLLSDARYFWEGGRNYVELNPHVCPAHIFRLRRRLRTERDFDYFM